MNKQIPETQSILAGSEFCKRFSQEKKQNVVCASFGLFRHGMIWGAGSNVSLNVRVLTHWDVELLCMIVHGC